MRLIYNMVVIPVNNQKFITVNTLNGLIDEIDKDTYNILKRWSTDESITPVTDMETALYEKLNNRGYLVKNETAERAIKDDIIEKLKLSHEKFYKNPGSVMFLLTYDCNFRCGYCFETEKPSTNADMPEKMVDAAFSVTSSNLKKISFFGGEPLLLKNRKIIEYITQKAKDKAFNVITNGYHLSEYIDLFRIINMDSVQVTLDGAKYTHDSRRFLAGGGPTYDKILDGIKKCLENKIKVIIRMNVDEGIINEAAEQQNILRESLPNANDYLVFETAPLFHVGQSYGNDVYKQLYNNLETSSMNEMSIKNRHFEMFQPLIKYFMFKESYRPLYNYCSAHNSFFIFDPLGDIYPCMPTVGNKRLAIGTYFPDVKFKENSVISRSVEKINECMKCNHALICGGGCPLGLPDHDDILKPNCSSGLRYIYEMIPYLYEKNFSYV